MAVQFNFSKLEGFDWDKGNLEHIRKHNVEYKECEEIFFNTPFLANKDQAHSQVEERFEVLGKTNQERLLFIVYTIRDGKIRIVSVRDQNRKERRRYEEIKENTQI